MKGKFITLEGADGAGKTTQIKHVVATIEQAGFEVVQTREPGGTGLGERVRELVKNSEGCAIGADAETLLIFAARAQHIEEVITPALTRGAWVVCDRFTDATYAYQGAGRGLGDARIAVLERWTQSDLRPDLTLFFDLTPEQSIQRSQLRNRQDDEAKDRFEREQLAFKQKLYDWYAKSCVEQPDRIKRVDASQNIKDVTEETIKTIDAFVQKQASANKPVAKKPA